MRDRMKALQREQDAFDQRVAELLVEHQGEFLVFHKGAPVGFFETYNEAYQAGIDRLGLDEVYLIAKVEEKKPETASLSWQFGVLG